MNRCVFANSFIRFLLREDMVFDSLPCRSKEQNSIYTMMHQSVSQKVSKSILISGVPGEFIFLDLLFA
jgi:hypothetical protein